MVSITEGTLRFEFDNNWTASKFDDWVFYRSQFMRLADAEMHCSSCEELLRCPTCNSKRVAGTKGVDIVAISEWTWLIEVKDYRQTRTNNFLFLADEVALKVRDTLAGLIAARVNANVAAEQSSAEEALQRPRFRIVLHLEQPVPTSSLHSKKSRKANVLQRLRQLVKSIDIRPIVVDSDDSNLQWTVSHVGAPNL